jgi:hypothetical protein
MLLMNADFLNNFTVTTAIPVMKWSIVIIFLFLSQSTLRTLSYLRVLQRNYPANTDFAYF